MGIPQKPINRIEQYLAGICTALGVVPDPEGGDAMKVFYLEESGDSLAARTGEGYATFAEYVDSITEESTAYIPAIVNGKVALEVMEGRAGYYNFITFDGIATVEGTSAAYFASYEVNSVADEGLYAYTVTEYTWNVTVAE